MHSQFYIYKNLQLKSKCYISISFEVSCLLVVGEVQEELGEEHGTFLVRGELLYI